jgi:predicted DNA-binding protein with PD1-like motif
VKTKLLSTETTKIYALVFDKGDEVMTHLLRFAEEEQLESSHLTAIGAFQRVVLQYFNPDQKAYEDIPVDQQVEVLALSGNVALEKDGIKIHAHTVVGLRDGSTRGGHLKEAFVFPTLEVVVEETPSYLRRRYDPETGLTLIDLDAREG